LGEVLADWQYVVLKPALKFLDRIQPNEQIRIVQALDELLVDKGLLDIKVLKGRPELRIRVGKYRILFIEDNETQTYVVTNIGPRGDIYK
jgi:mRNA interferase RelE/StbE